MAISDTGFNGEMKGKLELLTDTSGWVRLMHIIPKFGMDAIVLVIATIMINLLALALPLTLMQVYDRIIPNDSRSTLAWLMACVITAILLETVIKTLRSFISNWLSSRLEHILNTESIDYFLSSRLDKFEEDKAGVHYERFNAITIVKSYFSGQILLILLDIPFAFLFLGLLYYIGGGLVFYTLLMIFLFVAVIIFAKRKFERHNADQIELNKENLDFILESLGGVHTLKSLNMEQQMLRKFENIQGRIAESGLNANNWKSVPSNSAQFITQLNMIGVIFLGAEFVINGGMTLGAMTACTMFATRGIQPMIKIAGFWMRFSEVTNAQKQLEKIIALRSPDDMADIPVIRDIEGSVFFEDITLNDRNNNPLIEGFSVQIQAGEFIGITGENPELTTTLMLLLCGMYKPSSGRIFIDEYLISAMDHSHFNGRIEYLARKGRLFNGTILENISMFNSGKQDIALNAASLLGLDRFVADLPNGYETIVDQRANDSLPIGLIQRICFARTLVTCPRVLILDRTLNSMDDDSFNLVCEILETLRGRCTVFIVSGYGRFPLNVDRIIDCSVREIKIKSAE